ncbi:MAG: hypothetical protein C5B59_01520 [Bacteroidetes bacterium]|nr:MAG: hypothetical protein C5B59_01520 [Bacteroidota bacterium]
MFEILNSYLFQHKSISIPGLGTIYLETLPASVDTSSKNVLPPLYYFRFDRSQDAPSRDFFSFLASQKRIEDYEALKLYNEFAYSLRSEISREERFKWEGVGELRKDSTGVVQFESSLGNPFFLQPVPARKVIHPDAKHLLLVGDTERTNLEMSELLQAETESHRKRLWWILSLVVGIIATFIILFHFSSHGWKMESTGNQQTLQIPK